MKRTAAKRTPAKKAAATKPAEPVEETVTEDTAAEPEVESEATPASEQASADEPVEAPDEAVELDETAEEPSVDDADEAGSDDAPADEVVEPTDEEPGDTEATVDEPDESTDDEAVEAVDDQPVEPEEPAEVEEPAAEADEPEEKAEEPVPEPADTETAAEPDDVTEVEKTEDDEDDEDVEEPKPAEKPEDTDDDEHEEEPAPLVGRARLFDAITHFRRGQAAVAVLLCVLGYGAVVQVQTNTEDSTYAGLREQELIDILSGLAGTTQKAQEQIEELEGTRDELEDQTLQQQTALQRAEEQVDTLRVIAGTVPVSGPGVTIQIDPGPDPLRLTALLDLIEELRTSGAEAMEIEGADGEAVRLVASSAIEVSQPAPGLNVGGELVSPPYRLKVIGPPDTLAGAIDFYQGPQDQLEEQGAEVKVESEEKIDIESIHTVSR
ncbi:DUF881 domain-containing protein [Nocardioides sp. NPDC126508]